MARNHAFKHNKRDVMRALNAVLNSKQFVDSTQLSDFLRYIVTKTLDDQQEEIKAYTIAVDALGRSEDFDPQTNAAVRVAAGRLRQALALYNAEEAPADTNLKIVLEPGSYIPSFVVVEKELGSDSVDAAVVGTDGPDIEEESLPAHVPADVSALENSDLFAAPASPPSGKSDVVSGTFSFSKKFALLSGMITLGAIAAFIATYLYFTGSFSSAPVTRLPDTVASPGQPLKAVDINRRPTIRVVFITPDEPYPDWFKIGEVIDSIGVTIARFDDYKLLGLKRMAKPPQQTEQGSDYNIRVTAYKRDDAVRIFARLTSVQDNRIVWSNQWPFTRPDKLNERIIPELVGNAFSNLGSPYGVIYSDLVRTGPQRERLDCVVAAYKYFDSESDEQHLKARDCAEELVEKGSSLPSVYAALTFLYLDEFREGRNRRARDPLEAAQKMATRAVAMGPASARAHQALFAVHKVRGFRHRARLNAEKALELNPYDTDIMADYAAWLISIGDNDRGRKLLDRVGQILSARPAWVEFYRFLAAEMADDFQEADKIASLLDFKRSPLVALAVAISRNRNGNQIGTRAALDELLRVSPGFASDPLDELLRRGFDRAVAQKLVSKLVATGLQVSAPVAN